MELKNRIIECAKAEAADLVGFASAERFPKDDPIFKIFPEVKTVICLCFRVLRGIYRGIEEGTTFYQFSTMARQTLEETVLPIASLRVANLIEAEGYTALPQHRSNLLVKEEGDTNPEAPYKSIVAVGDKDLEMDFERSAVLCGIGELGFYGKLLTEEFGPMVRVCYILTDAEIEQDEIKKPHLCDGCGECAKGCFGHAIDEKTGKLDTWQCAVYYDGAAGIKNPFMNPKAFEEFENRIDIIAGEAKVDRELAIRIMDANAFYPGIKNLFAACMCGRACDMACYDHLEKKGVLTKKFRTPFRKREPWQFPIEDFEI
ncbi:MAG: hypothetical protein IKK94_04285 [Clostridia bacterium]|nr:hypothetical protein [Clostridia bacterium]